MIEFTTDAAMLVEAKLSELRDMLDASEAEGGSHATDEVLEFVRQHLARKG
jgi:hypothetical protein